MVKDNPKHKHHYVPESYLKGFYGSDDLLWVYNRKWKTYKQRAAAGIAYAEHYYTVDTVDEKNSTEIEDKLGIVESVALPLLVKLANGEEITPVERGDISTFLALQIVRVPDMDKRIKESHEKMSLALLKEYLAHLMVDERAFQEAKRDMKANGLEVDDFSRVDIQRMLSKDDIAVEMDIPRSYALSHALEMVQETATGLNWLNWSVLKAPTNKAFITTDNPFAVVGDGILGERSFKVFPLNRRRALLIGYTKNVSLQYKNVKARQVDMINDHIAYHSDQYIIGHSVKLLKDVVRRGSIESLAVKSRASVDSVDLGEDGSLLVLRQQKMYSRSQEA